MVFWYYYINTTVIRFIKNSTVCTSIHHGLIVMSNNGINMASALTAVCYQAKKSPLHFHSGFLPFFKCKKQGNPALSLEAVQVCLRDSGFKETAAEEMATRWAKHFATLPMASEWRKFTGGKIFIYQPWNCIQDLSQSWILCWWLTVIQTIVINYFNRWNHLLSYLFIKFGIIYIIIQYK